jgi:hypothetical protein
MLSSKRAAICILVIEILLMQMALMVFMPRAKASDGVPWYIRSISAPSKALYRQYFYVSAGIGGSTWNTVANNACHAYCTNQQENALYVYNDYPWNPAIWAEVGWMWHAGWTNPRWYVMRMNAGDHPEFHLFTENIRPGIPCIMKLQYVTESSVGQWRFYRTSDTSSGEIARLNGLDLRVGGLMGAGEKWDYSETNWSDFWGMQQRDSLTGWGDPWGICEYAHADDFYKYVDLNHDNKSFYIRPNNWHP